MLDPGRAHITQPLTIPTLPPLTTPVRELDDALWALLLKPGRLTAAEWAVIEARELAWRATQAS